MKNAFALNRLFLLILTIGVCAAISPVGASEPQEEVIGITDISQSSVFIFILWDFANPITPAQIDTWSAMLMANSHGSGYGNGGVPYGTSGIFNRISDYRIRDHH